MQIYPNSLYINREGNIGRTERYPEQVSLIYYREADRPLLTPVHRATGARYASGRATSKDLVTLIEFKNTAFTPAGDYVALLTDGSMVRMPEEESFCGKVAGCYFGTVYQDLLDGGPPNFPLAVGREYFLRDGSRVTASKIKNATRLQVLDGVTVHVSNGRVASKVSQRYDVVAEVRPAPIVPAAPPPPAYVPLPAPTPPPGGGPTPTPTQAPVGNTFAKQMAEFAVDAITMPDPWGNWQCRSLRFPNGEWDQCVSGLLMWVGGFEYRRKPYTMMVAGTVIDGGLVAPPARGKLVYVPSIMDPGSAIKMSWSGSEQQMDLLKRGLMFPTASLAVLCAEAIAKSIHP